MNPVTFPLRSESGFSRRSFLSGTASFAAAALLSSRLRGAVATSPRVPGYPFSLGIASGDPLPNGIVLWTRLAPKPLDPDGGMSAEPVDVSWQIAADEKMSRVVQRGTATARPEWAHSVHVDVAGLEPARWYWYQFKVGRDVSPIGRTRTAPPPDALPASVRFAFASCQRYQSGYYTAFEHMAREDLDLVLHVGDYIYEGESGHKGDVVERSFPTPHDCASLDDYRFRYSLYKTDPALQAAHAAAPWIVTWDDHEVCNDYAGDHDEHPDRFPRDAFLRRRAAAYQAYYEHQPLRRANLPHGPDMLLYRRLEFGRLVSFHVLDTRQYRTVQPQGGGRKPASPVLLDPKGTIMGDRQRAWLFDGLTRSPAAWNAVAQQVMFARVDLAPDPEVIYPMDKWSGYEFERRRLLRHFHDAKVRNPVVLSGDIHCNWANELIADFDDLDSASVATEFVGTSITSEGDGGEKKKDTDGILAENPFVKFFNNERGYVRCEVTPDLWRTDYQTVPYVTRRGAPLQTRATFHVESGRPKLVRV
jgi:alkaline phosphatase D